MKGQHTLELPDPERWGAAFEELLLRKIGLKAEAGRITVRLGAGVRADNVDREVNRWIDDNLARKRAREARRARRWLRRVSREDLEPLLGNKRQFRRREALGE